MQIREEIERKPKLHSSNIHIGPNLDGLNHELRTSIHVPMVTMRKLLPWSRCGKDVMGNGSLPLVVSALVRGYLTMVGDKGKLFSWSVASDSSVNVSTVHKNFEKFKIAALAYLPESSLLFGAAKRRICITDIVSGKDVRQVLLVHFSLLPRDVLITGIRIERYFEHVTQSLQ
jgi:hypothetical protein